MQMHLHNEPEDPLPDCTTAFFHREAVTVPFGRLKHKWTIQYEDHITPFTVGHLYWQYWYCHWLTCENINEHKALWSLFMTTITVGWSNKKYFCFDIWSPEAVRRFPSMELFILGSKCKGKLSLHGEGEEHLGSRSFIPEQPSFCFCKNSELTVCSRAVINFAWLPWSRVLCVELLSECLPTLRLHPTHS